MLDLSLITNLEGNNSNKTTKTISERRREQQKADEGLDKALEEIADALDEPDELEEEDFITDEIDGFIDDETDNTSSDAASPFGEYSMAVGLVSDPESEAKTIEAMTSGELTADERIAKLLEDTVPVVNKTLNRVGIPFEEDGEDNSTPTDEESERANLIYIANYIGNEDNQVMHGIAESINETLKDNTSNVCRAMLKEYTTIEILSLFLYYYEKANMYEEVMQHIDRLVIDSDCLTIDEKRRELMEYLFGKAGAEQYEAKKAEIIKKGNQKAVQNYIGFLNEFDARR